MIVMAPRRPLFAIWAEVDGALSLIPSLAEESVTTSGSWHYPWLVSTYHAARGSHRARTSVRLQAPAPAVCSSGHVPGPGWALGDRDDLTTPLRSLTD